jgi:hypothetical protein
VPCLLPHPASASFTGPLPHLISVSTRTTTERIRTRARQDAPRCPPCLPPSRCHAHAHADNGLLTVQPDHNLYFACSFAPSNALDVLSLYATHSTASSNPTKPAECLTLRPPSGRLHPPRPAALSSVATIPTSTQDHSHKAPRPAPLSRVPYRLRRT